jgi:sialidase-1
VLMVYGYRRPPYGVRGCISDDGITWDVANEFTIREGGVPADHIEYPGIFQHIGYPSATLLDDGSVLAMYHEYTDDGNPIQFIASTRFRIAD